MAHTVCIYVCMQYHFLIYVLLFLSGPSHSLETVRLRVSIPTFLSVCLVVLVLWDGFVAAVVFFMFSLLLMYVFICKLCMFESMNY